MLSVATATTWKDHLNRIQVTGGYERKLFLPAPCTTAYSPADASGESPFSNADTPWWCDFATSGINTKRFCPPFYLLPRAQCQFGIRLGWPCRERGRGISGYLMADPAHQIDRFANQARVYPISRLARCVESWG